MQKRLFLDRMQRKNRIQLGIFRFPSSESLLLGKVDVDTMSVLFRVQEISSKEGIVNPNLRNGKGCLEVPVCVFPHPSQAVPHLCSVQVCAQI